MIPIGLIISAGMAIAQKLGGDGKSKKAKVLQSLPAVAEAFGVPTGGLKLDTPAKLDLVSRYIDQKRVMDKLEAELAAAGIDL